MNPSSKWVGAAVLLISGCSHFQSPSILPQKDYSSELSSVALSAIKCQPMPVTGDQLHFSVKLTTDSPSVQLSSGVTRFLAYSLPDNVQEVEIQSYPLHAGSYKKAEIFYPEAALLDHNNQVLRTINKVSYQRQGIISTESLTTTIQLNQAEDKNAACLLVYTTDQARSERTPLMNQTKEYAQLRGNVAPPIPDVAARHGDNGTLSFSLKQGDTTLLIPVATIPVEQTVPDAFSDAMKSHYLEGVRQAIAEDDVKKALELRTEFQSILTLTEKYFVSQFGRDTDRIIEPYPPLDEAGFYYKALHHYQSETFRYLKTGQASSALKLQDSLKQLQQRLDAIFDQK